MNNNNLTLFDVGIVAHSKFKKGKETIYRIDLIIIGSVTNSQDANDLLNQEGFHLLINKKPLVTAESSDRDFTEETWANKFYKTKKQKYAYNELIVINDQNLIQKKILRSQMQLL